MQTTLTMLRQIDVRIGKIIEVRQGRAKSVPSYEVRVDFGPEIGIRTSSVGARCEYREEEMMGRLVAAVVNLPPRNIGQFRSEALILGVPGEDGSLSLLQPSRPAAIGGRMY